MSYLPFSNICCTTGLRGSIQLHPSIIDRQIRSRAHFIPVIFTRLRNELHLRSGKINSIFTVSDPPIYICVQGSKGRSTYFSEGYVDRGDLADHQPSMYSAYTSYRREEDLDEAPIRVSTCTLHRMLLIQL